jgi:acetolactate synthase regulatory subunit
MLRRHHVEIRLFAFEQAEAVVVLARQREVIHARILRYVRARGGVVDGIAGPLV